MAIKVTDVQGITVKVDGDLVGCLQTVGSLEETRAVKEYTCMSSNESAKSLGSISRGAIDIGLLLDETDVLGQKGLKDAFVANTVAVIAIELSDTLGLNGTIYTFDGKVSKLSRSFPTDEGVMIDFTVEMSSEIIITPAAAVVA